MNITMPIGIKQIAQTATSRGQSLNNKRIRFVKTAHTNHVVTHRKCEHYYFSFVINTYHQYYIPQCGRTRCHAATCNSHEMTIIYIIWYRIFHSVDHFISQCFALHVRCLFSNLLKKQKNKILDYFFDRFIAS